MVDLGAEVGGFWGSVGRRFVRGVELLFGFAGALGFAPDIDFGSRFPAQADLFCNFAAHCGVVWRDHWVISQ